MPERTDHFTDHPAPPDDELAARIRGAVDASGAPVTIDDVMARAATTRSVLPPVTSAGAGTGGGAPSVPAADDIRVPDREPTPLDPRRPRRPYLLAAAAVVVVILGAAAIVTRERSDDLQVGDPLVETTSPTTASTAPPTTGTSVPDPSTPTSVADTTPQTVTTPVPTTVMTTTTPVPTTTTAPPPALDPRGISLSGLDPVRIGMTSAEVAEVVPGLFGSGGTHCENEILVEASGAVELTMREDRVVYVHVESPAYATAEGAAVGMTVAETQARHPGVDQYDPGYIAGSGQLALRGPDSTIYFTYNEGLVSSITVTVNASTQHEWMLDRC